MFLYSSVLTKLGQDWWTEDNYSHGLLIPFVIAYIVWNEFDALKMSVRNSNAAAGLMLIILAAIFLLIGSMAAILFAQRISLVMMIVGILVYFFGATIIKKLAVPLLLLLLAIPIPQLIFNKIAFPLQLLASRFADMGIGLLGIPVERYGNVIEILPKGAEQIVSLEVVEACSGIRSLVTLITLALILGYFTRERRGSYTQRWSELWANRDVVRTVVLMLAAVPIALLTNSFRVMITGVLAYYYGRATVEEGIWHDLSGSLVFIAALALLIGLNFALKRWSDGLDRMPSELAGFRSSSGNSPVSVRAVVTLFASIVLCGVFVNWFQYRGEMSVERRPLVEIPDRLGSWEQRNADIRFDEPTEKVLKATDYVMRDYYGPGKRLNLYVGYYASQRSGATYHSPLSCLPGTGWEMIEPELLQISTPAGKQLTVNRYVVKQGEHKEYLIYWYQGRGRSFANEFEDKFFTSVDSLTKRRSDGGMVRIMTPLGKDPVRSLTAAIDLTSHVADNIGEFLPD